MRRPEQLPFDLPHASSSEREDLLVSGSNRLAVEAVDRWPDWPHPILVLVGPPGSGKTHLLEAWSRRSGAVRLDETSASSVLSRRGFAVTVDDLDRGSVDEAELFAVLNAARLGGGTVLVASRGPPAAMDWALADLRSRLSSAAVAELGPPDDELLSGVLLKLFSDRQLAVDPRLVALAAARIVRSLEAAGEFVRRIDREALASKKKVSRSLLLRILVEIERETPP